MIDANVILAVLVPRPGRRQTARKGELQRRHLTGLLQVAGAIGR